MATRCEPIVRLAPTDPASSAASTVLRSASEAEFDAKVTWLHHTTALSLTVTHPPDADPADRNRPLEPWKAEGAVHLAAG